MVKRASDKARPRFSFPEAQAVRLLPLGIGSSRLPPTNQVGLTSMSRSAGRMPASHCRYLGAGIEEWLWLTIRDQFR
jgi:hypothetical protein